MSDRLDRSAPIAVIGAGTMGTGIAQVAVVAAAARHRGVAGAADIDTAMRLGTNYPLGPLA
jgi:3-hydroxyacyl-CoA dehydrogenase